MMFICSVWCILWFWLKKKIKVKREKKRCRRNIVLTRIKLCELSGTQWSSGRFPAPTESDGMKSESFPSQWITLMSLQCWSSGSGQLGMWEFSCVPNTHFQLLTAAFIIRLCIFYLFIYLLAIKTNKQPTKQTGRFYLSPNDAHWQVKVCFWSPTLLEIAALPTGKFQIQMKWKEANQRWHIRQQLRENAERRNRTCNFICHHEAAITLMWRGGNSASAGSRWLQEARLLVDWISGRNWRVLYLQKSAIFS